MSEFGTKESTNAVKDEKIPEKGANVQIIIKIMRHADKLPDNSLTPYGKKRTRAAAEKSGIKPEGFKGIKAYGSNAEPSEETGMGRALKTADIYTETLTNHAEISTDGDKQAKKFNTRENKRLNYHYLRRRITFDRNKMYKEQLPANFEQLSDEEKAIASHKAHNFCSKHMLSLTDPESIAYMKEVAGSFAAEIDQRQKVAKKLKSGSKFLLPTGTHSGPYLELILYYALARKDAEGKETVGLKDLDEIGGAFEPVEAFNIFIETDAEGKFKPIRITFDNPNRPQGEMYLDEKKLDELREFYENEQFLKVEEENAKKTL